jgi:nucleotide-binding universal stress UspA family protein
MQIPPKRILVATDFSENAEAATDYAIDLAKRLNAEIVLVHAYETPTYAFPEGAVIQAELLDRLARISEEALASATKKRAQCGVPFRSVLQSGPPWREIIAAAEKEHADLIVIGTHGRRGLSRMIMGSVAERVVRSAPCPVLTIRPGK